LDHVFVVYWAKEVKNWDFLVEYQYEDFGCNPWNK